MVRRDRLRYTVARRGPSESAQESIPPAETGGRPIPNGTSPTGFRKAQDTRGPRFRDRISNY